ncbi:hypothetical protein TNCV_1311941 [Trichonephila clavipes]|nr:hypothetical protein TNCV_1311941 [Trichonephila clavipes]
MLRAYGTKGPGFCPSDRHVTSLMALVEFRKGNLLICRGGIYPQKEPPKPRLTHLEQQNKLARLTWRSKTKFSNSLDATPPIKCSKLLAQHACHNNYIIRSPIHQLTSGGVCSGFFYVNHFTPNAAVLLVDVAIQPEVHFTAKQNYENREQRQSRFGPIRRIYALLDHI